MKGFKSKFLKTLKSLPHVGHSKPNRVLHVEEPDEFFDASPSPHVARSLSLLPISREEPRKEKDGSFSWKKSSSSSSNNNHQEEPRSWVAKVKSQEEPSLKLPCNQVGFFDPLTEFPDICPPGGRDAIVLYTTSLRGVRKTFSDCTKVRSLLENMRVVFQERDISMDMGYREELWRVLGWRATPPSLFIRGKYIGGAEEVIALQEQGKLKPLLPRQPTMQPGRASCGGCGGVRFIVCCECNGGRKLYDDENSAIIRCPYCNENGLVQCLFCCY